MRPFTTRDIARLCHRSPAWVTSMARKHGLGTVIRLPHTPGRGMWMFSKDDLDTMAGLCRYNKGGE